MLGRVLVTVNESIRLQSTAPSLATLVGTNLLLDLRVLVMQSVIADTIERNAIPYVFDTISGGSK